MRAVFLLQISNQSSQRLALLGHNIGKQQAIQYAVTLRKIARVTDSAGLFSADCNLTIHHQICNVLETDRALVDLSSIFGRDAIDHAGGVERSDYFAWPLLALEQPAQQHGKAFVRLDEAAILCHRAITISIPVGRETCIASLHNYRLLKHRDVWFDRLGINAREQRIQFLPDRDALNSVFLEN